MIDLPVAFIKFYFFDSLKLLYRFWKNTLAMLEEDLAVSLMIRLIFTPLFHDSSIVGRLLSFIFRAFRILIGFFAYVVATVVILTGTCFWIAAPVLLFSTDLSIFAAALIILGTFIFLVQYFTHPRNNVRQVSTGSEIYSASTLPKSRLTLDYLAQTPEVTKLARLLEIEPDILGSGSFIIYEPALTNALNLARNTNATYLSPAYFWVACLLSAPDIDSSLMRYNLSPSDLTQALQFLELEKNYLAPNYLWSEHYHVGHLAGVNRGWLGAPTPILDSVSVDLTSQETSVDRPEFIGRQEQYQSVISTLSSSRRNVLLIGPSGTGKTLLVKYLANLINQGDAPASISTKRLVQIDLTKLLIGVSGQGDLAAKLEGLFNEVRFIQDIVLFIDEIENLGIGQTGQNLNLYALLQPYLEAGDIQFIAAVDDTNFARVIEPNGSFTRLFQYIQLPPATIEETYSFLVDKAAQIAVRQQILFSLPALHTLVEYSQKYIHSTVLPDSARQLFHQAIDNALTTDNFYVSTEIIKKLLSDRVQLPVVDLNDSARAELIGLEDKIHLRMIDQQDAVKSVVNTLKRAAVSLQDNQRPIGSFLFVGPTGVGKTELAKILHEEYFHTKAGFLRLDMSEYQSTQSIDRLIGDAYNPGLLTDTVNHHPYSLILLDEFEKADSKILNLFLQVLEDGRLTDGRGKTIDFTNTIIIATSNAAALTIANGLQSNLSYDQIKTSVQQELLHILKPELLNRFDAVIIFKPLSTIDLRQVVTLKLTHLQTKLKDQGYLIDFSPSLIDQLTTQGYDPVMGARPLRRLIQDTLESQISDQILAGSIQKGTPATIDHL